MTGNGRSFDSPKICILGLGNWGTSLAYSLRSAEIPLDEVIVRTAASGMRNISRRRFRIRTLEDARLEARIFWLCVPDSVIAPVTHRLVERIKAGSRERPGSPLRGRIIVHSSGALSSGVLREASEAGAAIGSAHPMMTFPTRTPISLAGTLFGVEGDRPACGQLNKIIRRFKGRPFPLDTAGKALYHAAATLASPLLASLLTATQQTAILAGLTSRQARRLIEPIAQVTLQNVFSRGSAASFSGPIARGDANVIHLHLQALMRHPMLAEVYRSLALYGIEALPAQNKEKLRDILRRTTLDQSGRASSSRQRRMRD